MAQQEGRVPPRPPGRPRPMAGFGALRNGIGGEMMAEFLGTFALIAFGDGAGAVAVAGLTQSGRTPAIFVAAGDWLLITWGWALAVTFGVYIAGGVTGAHINPAVTLAFAVRGHFAWRKVVPYWVAQWLGAFLGAALVYGVYSWAIGSYEVQHHILRGAPASVTTFSIFGTFPSSYFHTWWGPLIDQVAGTAFLLMFIAALIDRRNMAPRANLAPLLIGLVVAAIGISYGANAGYAINPARDFGPRVWAWVVGWGQVALPGNYGNVNGYVWIPIVGPFIGGILGVLIYDVFIRGVLVARGVPEVAE